MEGILDTKAKTEIRTTKQKGRSVFASKTIQKGEEICCCHVIVFPKEDQKAIKNSLLDYYVFSWPSSRDKVSATKWSLFCLPLGVAALINHSSNPNSFWTVDKKEKTLSFYASKKINAGEEITHDYHWPKSMTEGFED